MLAFLFPGQGSQSRGMGHGLFDEVQEYASVEQDVNALLGYSMRALCLEDPQSLLKQTQYTQPSLYVVNALHYYKAISSNPPPAYVAGHSLGEYNALLAAGAFDFITGLKIVKRRGELMAQAKNGGMAAVIGLSAAKVEDVIQSSGLSAIDIANFNSPTQIVISGPVGDIQSAGAFFEKAGSRMYIPLQVSAAFHSRYVMDAANAFSDFLVPFIFSELTVPVISNVLAQPYPAHNVSETIKSILVKQVTHPVKWAQSIRYLQKHGVNEFREVGPGSVLTRLLAQITAEVYE
jgi:malonyl CoA-acyl carrier protein transacylase